MRERIVVFSGLVLAGAAFFAWGYYQSEQEKRFPRSTVRRAVNCIAARDLECYRRLANADIGGGPTQTQWASFQKEVFVPRMSGFESDGDVHWEVLDQGRAIGVQRYKHVDGRVTEFVLTALHTPKGPTLSMSWSSIVVGVAHAAAWTKTENRSARSRRLVLALKPEMERIGITGAAISTNKGVDFHTWDQWAALYQTK